MERGGDGTKVRKTESDGNNKSMTILADAERVIRSRMGVTDDATVARLLATPVSDFTAERVQRLVRDERALQAELSALENVTGADLWRADVAALRPALVAMCST